MSDSIDLFSENSHLNYREDSNTFSDGGCTIDESERIPTNLTIATQIEIQKSIQKQLVNYNIKKSARNATPPYVTYTEDELIYLPVMMWLGSRYMAHTDYTDAEYSQLIDWINEMLAGTYDYVPSEFETQANGTPASGGAYVAAQNDVNHGIDSGIRLRLMPRVPKHMFNPLFQVAKPFTDNDTDARINYISIPSITSGDVLNMRTGEELPGAWSDHTLNNTTFLEAFERKNYMATRRRSIANLTEDRVGSFTCGPYGAVMRLRNTLLTSLDVSNLNAYDCYQTFSDGEIYDVYSINDNTTLLSQGPVLHRHINYASPTVLNSVFDGEGTNMARMIPAIHYFMFYASSSSQASFPVSNQLASPLLTVSRNGWHKNTNMSKSQISSGGTQDRRNVASIMFHELGHTLGCYHAFHFGHQGYNSSPSSPINFTNIMETDPKGKFLPFINTKKSWYSNADSNIPPFEYTEAGYNEDGENVSLLKSYKDLPADEQGYLEMMFNTLPKHLTNNYERKINFNTGSATSDFYFDHNYPSHFHSAIADSFVGVIQGTSESALKSQLKWKTVLNNYLAMCLGLDSLWGDSYILLDDNGDNVNIESGGKPEFVVNPTTDLIDGMLTTTRDFVWGGGAIGGVQQEQGELTIENINLIDDIKEGEFNYNTIRACNYPELGGYAIKKSGNNVLILSDSMQYNAPSHPLIRNGQFPGSGSYHGFNDWFLPSQVDYQTLRNIFYRDNDSYLLNNAAPNPDSFGNLALNWGIKKNTFYYMRGPCSTAGTSGTYQLGYTTEGVNAFWFRDNGEGSVSPYYWCTDTRSVARPDGATMSSYALPADVGGNAHNSAFGYFVRTVHVPNAQVVEEEQPPVTGGIEVLPANRKGPQITNRVPFCVPVLNESTGLYEPSDVFDPVWFGNINWRDPKNRAYPENWPVSKLYDEFDAKGDPLCPCLYVEQTVWIDGVERTYTPINASRTGFIPEIQGNPDPFNGGGNAATVYARAPEGKSGADWVENEANANSLLNEDAQILYKIQSHSFLKDHPTKDVAGANTEKTGYNYNEGAAGFPIESWNNSSMYVDSSNDIKINSSLDSYPINTFTRGSKSSRKKLYPSFGCSFNGHQIHNSHLSALSYPHSKGHFFQNYPIGYKPFPGGYSTDIYTSTDPIHYMMAPFGSAYVGINPHGSAHKKFKPDWQNFADEHAASPNTSFSFSGLDYIPSADLTHVIESDLFNTLYFWNGEDDLPTLQYTDSGGMKTSTQLEYVKYTFGSTDVASPYYNPLRLNLFKSSDLTIFRSAGMVDPILSDFSVFYGNTVLDANGEPQTLLNRHSPSIGDINVGILNNTMRYGLNAYLIDVAFLEDIDDTCFVLINTKPNRRWGCSSNHWKSVPGATGGLHLGRFAMTPGQIFKARAFIENNVGNLQAIRDFGIENNVRASYTEENSFANHIEYCLLKAEGSQEYITEGGLNFDFYDSFFDTSNTTSCDNGHCLESTPIAVCIDSEGCNNIQTQNINTQFLPISDGALGPKIRCPQNLLNGCYFEAKNNICNYIVTTANTNLYCDVSGNETTLEICSDLGNTAHASLWLGTTSFAQSLFTSEGEDVSYGNFYEHEGQLYSNYLETTTKVYYYNPTQITEDEKQKASKKFEKLHKNLTKIVSFAK